MRRLAALLVVAVLAGAGCGGDDGDGEPQPSEPAAEEPAAGEQQGPPKSEVVSRADAICSQAKVAIDMARTRFHHGNFDQASPAELEGFVRDRIVPVYRNELASLDKLPRPSGDGGQLDEVVESGEQAADALDADPAKVSPVGGSALFDEANRLAASYGLSVCVAP